ncbi:unnamed protein product [Coregonus sp. 'balchen']|nr:unnamed protein product [Coregonus sp. 'balchen']
MTVTTIKDGEYTATVYKMIKDGRYGEAIHILSHELQKQMKSRAALSLLGYCYYHMQDFTNAAECYEQLTQLHPETLVEQLPQDDPDYEVDMGCLLYKEGEYEEACKKFMSAMQVLGYQPDLSYNIGLCYYSMKQYAQALKFIGEIIERGIREHPELSVGMTTEGIDVRSVGNTLILHETALIEGFNLKAAIEYQLKNCDAAQEALTDMPPRSEERVLPSSGHLHQHTHTDGDQGNGSTLSDRKLLERELDPVTLHNQALMNMDKKPSEGFEKLAFLLQQIPFPPVTFGNLLLLYCKYEYFDLAADVMAENAHLTYKFLTPYLYEFLDAMLTCQTAPEEAFRKFDEMNAKLTDQLRKLAKQVTFFQSPLFLQLQEARLARNLCVIFVSKVQEARLARDNEALKKTLQDYDEMVEKYIPVLMTQAKIYRYIPVLMTQAKIYRYIPVLMAQAKIYWYVTVVLSCRYIPVLMAQAKIYWNRENYQMVEKIFRKSVEFCNEHDTWKLNVAHVLFMQENKYKEAIGFYEPIVKKHYDNVS